MTTPCKPIIRSHTPDGQVLIALDSKGKPATDYTSVTGWALETKPVHAGKRRK